MVNLAREGEEVTGRLLRKDQSQRWTVENLHPIGGENELLLVQTEKLSSAIFVRQASFG